MSTKYRIKIYNVSSMRGYIAIEDIWMRTVVSGTVVNLVASGTATAFSNYDGNYIAAAALSGQSYYWHSGGTTQAVLTAGDAWWAYDFNADAVYIREYTMRSRGDSGLWLNDSPKNWVLEWYNPSTSTWIVIDERTNVSWTASELKTFSINRSQVIPTYYGRNTIALNNNYIFRSTASGVEVYNTVPTRLGFINSGTHYRDVFTNENYGVFVNVVWADDDSLYIGTDVSGVLRSPISSISGGVYNNVQAYKSYPDITNNNVLDIYGNGDYLCVVTASGIDELHISTADHYFTTVSGAQRCFQTASGIYYTTAGNLHVVYDLNSNWTTPSYSYNSTKHESFIEVNTINDLVVVSGVICVGTNAGVVTIFEARGNERTSPYKIYKIK